MYASLQFRFVSPSFEYCWGSLWWFPIALFIFAFVCLCSFFLEIALSSCRIVVLLFNLYPRSAFVSVFADESTLLFCINLIWLCPIGFGDETYGVIGSRASAFYLFLLLVGISSEFRRFGLSLLLLLLFAYAYLYSIAENTLPFLTCTIKHAHDTVVHGLCLSLGFAPEANAPKHAVRRHCTHCCTYPITKGTT